MSLAKCGCNSDKKGNTTGASFQDRRYGSGMRVQTTTQEGNKIRCTVCGKESPAKK